MLRRPYIETTGLTRIARTGSTASGLCAGLSACGIHRGLRPRDREEATATLNTMLNDITRQLYTGKPDGSLYHYTTFRGLMGIVENRCLWASDIRYMNDSAELRHTVNLLSREVTQRLDDPRSNATALNSFVDWVSHRVTNGHLVFASSFRSHGNLLSQWRGYSTVGKGVSLGFDSDYIVHCAREQSFVVGQCIYDPKLQHELIAAVIDVVSEVTRGQPQEQWHHLFAELETELLRIAALLKHPSFAEEQEWRIVSPAMTDFMSAQIRFREGTSMLVPYCELELRTSDTPRLPLEHIYLGPTAHITLSLNSLAMYLQKHGAAPRRGIDYCDIPYRQV